MFLCICKYDENPQELVRIRTNPYNTEMIELVRIPKFFKFICKMYIVHIWIRELVEILRTHKTRKPLEAKVFDILYDLCNWENEWNDGLIWKQQVFEFNLADEYLRSDWLIVWLIDIYVMPMFFNQGTCHGVSKWCAASRSKEHRRRSSLVL